MIFQNAKKMSKKMLCENLPVVGRNIELVACAAEQSFQGVFFGVRPDLDGNPVTKFGFIVDCVAVYRFCVCFVRFEFDCEGVCCCRGQSNL